MPGTDMFSNILISVYHSPKPVSHNLIPKIYSQCEVFYG